MTTPGGFEDIGLRNITVYKPDGNISPTGATVLVCTGCGALVPEDWTAKHADWHLATGYRSRYVTTQGDTP